MRHLALWLCVFAFLNGGVRAQQAFQASGAVSNTYTASTTTAIAPSDIVAQINISSSLSLTLAAGLTNGHELAIQVIGGGTATVTMSFEGTSTPIILPSGSVWNIAWNAGQATWNLAK